MYKIRMGLILKLVILILLIGIKVNAQDTATPTHTPTTTPTQTPSNTPRNTPTGSIPHNESGRLFYIGSTISNDEHFCGGRLCSTVEYENIRNLPRNAKFQWIAVEYVNTESTTVDTIFTLRINGVDTGLTCTVVVGQRGCVLDLFDSVINYTANDDFTLKVSSTSVGTTTTFTAAIGVLEENGTPFDSIVQIGSGGGGFNAIAVPNAYCGPGLTGTISFNANVCGPDQEGTEEARFYVTAPGKISGLAIHRGQYSDPTQSFFLLNLTTGRTIADMNVTLSLGTEKTIVNSCTSVDCWVLAGDELVFYHQMNTPFEFLDELYITLTIDGPGQIVTIARRGTFGAGISLYNQWALGSSAFRPFYPLGPYGGKYTNLYARRGYGPTATPLPAGTNTPTATPTEAMITGVCGSSTDDLGTFNECEGPYGPSCTITGSSNTCEDHSERTMDAGDRYIVTVEQPVLRFGFTNAFSFEIQPGLTRTPTPPNFTHTPTPVRTSQPIKKPIWYKNVPKTN